VIRNHTTGRNACRSEKKGISPILENPSRLVEYACDMPVSRELLQADSSLHVLNRENALLDLEHDRDYAALERDGRSDRSSNFGLLASCRITGTWCCGREKTPDFFARPEVITVSRGDTCKGGATGGASCTTTMCDCKTWRSSLWLQIQVVL
jgi:hypothetical protein